MYITCIEVYTPVLLMARGPDAFFYGFTGIINHRFLTNQITRTISVIL